MTTQKAYSTAAWQMPFNLAKCGHLIVTNKPHPLIYHYKKDYTIQNVESINYLCLIISHNLSWSEHISGIVGKANSVLAFFRET